MLPIAAAWKVTYERLPADADIKTQASVTSKKPSRALSSRLWRRVSAAISRPSTTLIPAAMAKSMNMPSCMMIEQIIGRIKVTAKNAIIKPRTWATASMPRALRLAPAGGFAEEETLDLIDVSPVGDEQHHVIIGLNDGVVMRHDYFLAPNDTADLGALR